MKNEWFASWFDTDYYHILYQDRNDAEAKRFITNLTDFLKLPLESKVLDLACGTGRHSITLNELGYDVVGVDLSPNSIKQASVHQNNRLSFIVHDMREVVPNETFDVVFNLFTSFGYFDDTSDNLKVLQSIHAMLSPKGILVIDFMNASKVIKELVTHEEKEQEGIVFNIERSYDGQFIFKGIVFEDKGEEFHYTERVQAIKLENFENLLAETEFEILRTFGDFDLAPFDQNESDRLIIIAQKK